MPGYIIAEMFTKSLMNPNNMSDYHAYLLRIWVERPADPEQDAVWRFSLEEVPDGPRRGFSNLEVLTDYLKTLIFHPKDKGART